MDTNTYKRCEFIIRQYLSVDSPSPELMARFNGWLTDGRHCREKNLIMRKVFYEVLSGGNPEQPDGVLTSGDTFFEKNYPVCCKEPHYTKK